MRHLVDQDSGMSCTWVLDGLTVRYHAYTAKPLRGQFCSNQALCTRGNKDLDIAIAIQKVADAYFAKIAEKNDRETKYPQRGHAMKNVSDSRTSSAWCSDYISDSQPVRVTLRVEKVIGK